MRLGGSKLTAWLTLIAGTGLALLPFRMNLPVSLPQIGLCLTVLGFAGILIIWHKSITLGSYWAYILVIAGSIIVSAMLNNTPSGAAVGVLAILAYLVSRIAKDQILLIFPIIVVAISIGYLVQRITGWEFIPNYNIAGFALVTGIVVSYYLRAYFAIPIGLVGLALSGGYEYLASIALLSPVALLGLIKSRQYSKLYLLLFSSALLLIVGLEQYSQLGKLFTDPTLNDRLPYAMQPLAIFGHGYSANVDGSSIHNTVLIIVDQIGILGAIAFCLLFIQGLVSRYWILFLAWIPFILLDNMLWTQVLPWLFIITGILSARRSNATAKNDKADIKVLEDTNLSPEYRGARDNGWGIRR